MINKSKGCKFCKGKTPSLFRYCPICGRKLPTQTNADRIRAMSDEELAEKMKYRAFDTICDIVCGGDCKARDTIRKTSSEVCKDIILAWLQQPAEEDNDG